MQTSDYVETTCLSRSCRAAVIKLASATSDATLILDATPTKMTAWVHEDGEVCRRRREVCPQTHAGIRLDVYTDHHATCPDAASWRRTRAAAR